MTDRWKPCKSRSRTIAFLTGYGFGKKIFLNANKRLLPHKKSPRVILISKSDIKNKRKRLIIPSFLKDSPLLLLSNAKFPPVYAIFFKCGGAVHESLGLAFSALNLISAHFTPYFLK